MMNVSYRKYLLPDVHYIMSLFHLWKRLYAKNSWWFSLGPVTWLTNFALIQSVKLGVTRHLLCLFMGQKKCTFATVLSQTVGYLYNIYKRLVSNLKGKQMHWLYWREGPGEVWSKILLGVKRGWRCWMLLQVGSVNAQEPWQWALAGLEILQDGGALSWSPCPSAAVAHGYSCSQHMHFILLHIFLKMLLSLLGWSSSSKHKMSKHKDVSTETLRTSKRGSTYSVLHSCCRGCKWWKVV